MNECLCCTPDDDPARHYLGRCGHCSLRIPPIPEMVSAVETTASGLFTSPLFFSFSRIQPAARTPHLTRSHATLSIVLFPKYRQQTPTLNRVDCCEPDPDERLRFCAYVHFFFGVFSQVVDRSSRHSSRYICDFVWKTLNEL